MTWHDRLLYFGQSDEPDIELLKCVIEKSVIPVFQQHLENSFDIWNPLHNTNCFKILGELREYISLRSNAIQNLLDTLEELIDASVNQVLKMLPLPLHRGKDDVKFEYRQRKQRSIGKILSFMDELLRWRKFFPNGVVQRWMVKKMLEPICTAIECNRDPEFDLLLYQRVRLLLI